MSKTEITISADSSIQGGNWTMYSRVDFKKDSLLIFNLRNIIKDCYEVDYENLIKTVRLYLKQKTERSNVDLYVNEDSFEICKPNKTLPTIWVVKDK